MMPFRMKQMGVYLEERTTHHGESAPYKLWHADLLECPTCGHEIVAGFGKDAAGGTL